MAECRGQSAPFENAVGDGDIAAQFCFAVHDLPCPIIAGALSLVQALILADSPHIASAANGRVSELSGTVVRCDNDRFGVGNSTTMSRSQVRRWQRNTGLGWSEQEIVEVTRYLNGRYYRFIPPARQARLDAERVALDR